MKHLIMLFALSLALSAQADERTQTVTTQFQGKAADGKGASLRKEANDLARMIEAKRFEQARQGAMDLCKRYETLFDPALKQYVFESRSEYESFKTSTNGKLEWIDRGYQQCLHIQAFVAAERRDFAGALAVLKRIEALAPTSAGTPTEMGYILGQSKRPEESLAAYRRAVETSQKYSSQLGYRAAALRGVGFALIELHRLDEAEAALRDSLKIEPGNAVALNEIAYINDLRKAR